VRENAAQYDDRQFLALEFDEEDSPRLASGQRAQLMNGLDMGGGVFLQPEFSRREFKSEFVKAIFSQRPVELLFEVADEIGKGLDVAKILDGHQLSSIQHLSTGETPSGACRGEGIWRSVAFQPVCAIQRACCGRPPFSVDLPASSESKLQWGRRP
jgi:hypothetical protein